MKCTAQKQLATGRDSMRRNASRNGNRCRRAYTCIHPSPLASNCQRSLLIPFRAPPNKTTHGPPEVVRRSEA
eukprot:3052671-Pleurochrysis_carterae.AAC.8